MKKHLSKKRVVLAAIVAVALAISSGVAYAYWTSNGTGGGTANAAGGGSLAVDQPVAVSGLYPGIVDQDVSIVVTNNESYVQGLSAVDSSIDSIAPATCLESWFVVTDATVPASTTIDPGGSVTLTGKIRMLEVDTNQNDCKNAVITLTHDAS